MSKKRLLIFIDWFYPGFKGGGPMASCLNLINEVHQDFEIFIFTRANDYLETKNYEDILTNQWQNFQNISKIYYCNNKDLSIIKIYKIINEVKPNIVYLNGMFSTYFTIVPIFLNHFIRKIHINCKLILVPRGMLIDGKLQFKKTKKLIFLNLFRVLGLQRKLYLQVTSEAEKEASIFRLKLLNTQSFLIPNVPHKHLLSKQVSTKKRKELRLFFASRVAREKNILFILNLLKKINLPISLDIFGAIDHLEYWELCKETIEKLPQCISVNYKGVYKPDDIQNIFKSYHAFILPTFGENFGHVIIEALAIGKPIITTPTTPWSEIENNNAGWIIDLENEDKYSEVLRELYEMDNAEYQIKANAAFDYAKAYMQKINYRKLYKDFFLSI